MAGSGFHFINVLLPEEAEANEGANGEPDDNSPPQLFLRPNLKMLMDTLDVCRSEGFITSRPLAASSACADGTPANNVSFVTEGRFTGEVINRLLRIRVGCLTGYGSVNVLPLEYHMSNRAPDAAKRAASHQKSESMFTSQLETLRFIENVEKGSHLTFDYCALLIVASIIAGVGLVTDNTVVIVASMLVSPLMGPILATTVAICCSTSGVTMVQPRLGFVNGLVSLAVSVAMGFAIGLCCAPLKSVVADWPTDEMASRGEVSGLVTGTIIALASGVGVSLSSLSSNANSLVGVAISASLLPPAVNAGICWSYALVGGRFAYGPRLHGEDRSDYIRIGYVSLALTILNIVCVFVSGWAIFKAKMQLQMTATASAAKSGLGSIGDHIQATVKIKGGTLAENSKGGTLADERALGDEDGSSVVEAREDTHKNVADIFQPLDMAADEVQEERDPKLPREEDQGQEASSLQEEKDSEVPQEEGKGQEALSLQEEKDSEVPQEEASLSLQEEEDLEAPREEGQGQEALSLVCSAIDGGTGVDDAISTPAIDGGNGKANAISTSQPSEDSDEEDSEEEVVMWKKMDPRETGFVNIQSLLKHESWLKTHVPGLVDSFPRLANSDFLLSRGKFMVYYNKNVLKSGGGEGGGKGGTETALRSMSEISALKSDPTGGAKTSGGSGRKKLSDVFGDDFE